ncbi:transcriptional regulator domain-containing protein [Bradyrhizobium sp. USDA 4520]
MAVETSDWRSSSTYDFVDDLVAPDLAWEWLRRNVEYQRDYEAFEAPNSNADTVTDLVRRKWGLLFRRFPQPEGNRGNDILGAGSRPQHSHPYRHIALGQRDQGV